MINWISSKCNFKIPLAKLFNKSFRLNNYIFLFVFFFWSNNRKMRFYFRFYGIYWEILLNDVENKKGTKFKWNKKKNKICRKSLTFEPKRKWQIIEYFWSWLGWDLSNKPSKAIKIIWNWISSHGIVRSAYYYFVVIKQRIF